MLSIDKNKYMYFIGIGGTGMSGIAQVLLELGYKIAGSDIKYNNNIKRLEKKGATIFIGHNHDNIQKLDNVGLVVISSAISDSNSELIWAKNSNIPILKRAEVLGYILNNKFGIAISGTHGKTTTTSMISMLMENNGLNPTVIVGGEACDFKGNAKVGGGTYTVVEADESDASFLYLTPQVIVTTNIEEDHLDFYNNISQINEAFKKFFNKLKPNGTIVYCSDNYNLNSLREYMPSYAKIYTYGLDKTKMPDYLICDVRQNGMGISFEVKTNQKSLGRFKLNVPGIHNALNATAAIIVCNQVLNISQDQIRSQLLTFKGVERRFQVIGEVNGITIIDDYAHHPTEVEAILKTAKSSFNKRIIAIFQPHRFTRTKYFYNEFANALNNADLVILTDIYHASEKPISGVTSELILNSLYKIGKKNSVLINNIKDIPNYIASIAKQNDFIFTIGAGDITSISTDILKKLNEKQIKNNKINVMFA